MCGQDPRAPKRTARVQVHACTTLTQGFIDPVDGEIGMTALERETIAWLGPVPITPSDPLGQQLVEDLGTGSGEPEATPLTSRTAGSPLEECLGPDQVTLVVTESLLAEIIGNTPGTDEVEPRIQLPDRRPGVPDQNPKSVSRQDPATELAPVRVNLQHLDAVRRQGRPVGPTPARTRDGEPLAGDGMAVFEPSVANRRARRLHQGGQAAGDPFGVGPDLADAKQQVVTHAVRREPKTFLDLEVSMLDPETTAIERPTVRPRKGAKTGPGGSRPGAHRSVRSTAAEAAIPSPRPVKPISSMVVALTLTRLASQPRSSARVRDMAGI